MPPFVGTSQAGAARWQAILWYLAVVACGAAMIFLIRRAAAEVHPLEVSFFRCLFGAILLLPVALARRLPWPAGAELRLHVIRALLVAGSMLCAFWALNLISILETNVLGSAAPLFAAIGAALFLKERIGPARWLALGLGFAGVVMAMRPNFTQLGLGTILALGSAILAAGSWLILKVLSRRTPAWAVVTILTFLMTPMTLVPALFVWRWPDAETLFWLALLAAAATAGQYAATRAFALADVSYLAPFQFLDLIVAGALGWLVFGEPLTVWTAVGGALVVASIVYLARYDAAEPRSAPG